MRITKTGVSTKGHWMRLAALLLVLAIARSLAQLPNDLTNSGPTAVTSAAEETDALEPSRPGPVVADVRVRLALGYGFGEWATLGVEPEVLFLWPSGRGIGVDLGLDAVGNSSNVGSGGMYIGGFGLKYAVMRRIGNGPLYYKTGAGASLLTDSWEYESGTWKFRPGARVRLEGGLSPVAGSRVAFPVEGVLTVEFYGSGGAQLSLGLSVGAGWVFADR